MSDILLKQVQNELFTCAPELRFCVRWEQSVQRRIGLKIRADWTFLQFLDPRNWVCCGDTVGIILPLMFKGLFPAQSGSKGSSLQQLCCHRGPEGSWRCSSVLWYLSYLVRPLCSFRHNKPPPSTICALKWIFNGIQ